jgi:COP9 signalosome complex subunit 2
MSKGNLLLEVFALEIQMCIETKEQRRMKDVFILTEKFTSVIEDPRVVGIIKECGGKMYMSEKRWEMAH